MTQIPQSSNTQQAADQGPDGDDPAQSFTAILPEPVQSGPPRKLLVVGGVAVVIAILGMIFSGGEPDSAKAKAPAALDAAGMTSQELAENAGFMAARELARRMMDGTPAEQASVTSILHRYRTPRLARNLAMAMALEQQKKQQEWMREAELDRQMMNGPGGGMYNGR